MALIPACSSPVYVDATVIGTGFGAPELPSLRAVRLELDPAAGDPLRDRIVADFAVAVLNSRGIALTEDAKVELVVHGYVLENEHWVPPETRVTHSYWPMYPRRYCVDGRWITVQEPGVWVPQTWVVPGHTVREYSHRAEVVLQEPSGKVLWMGELRADGRTGDFFGVMKACMPLLFAEYPVPSGQPAERRVVLAPVE